MAKLCVRVPLYNPIRDKFPSLLENVILGSPKFAFKLDHQVGTSLYLTEALGSKELVVWNHHDKPSTLKAISLDFSMK